MRFNIINLLLLFLPVLSPAQDYRLGRVVNTRDGPELMRATIENSPITIQPDPKAYYYYYYKGVIHKAQGGHTGYLLHGKFESMYLNNNIHSSGCFAHGLKKGIWYHWYENGNLKSIESWKKGKKSGRFQEFDENGLLNRSGLYNKDQLKGKVRTYENGRLVKVQSYKHGVLHKEYTIQDK